MLRARTFPRFRIAALAGIALALGVGSAVRAADHADSPDTSEGNLDINDLYVFNQGDDVVFAMTVAPLLTPGEATNSAALNPEGLYQIKLDKDRDGVAEAVLQVAVAGTGAEQLVTVRGPMAISASQPDQLIEQVAVRGAFNTTLTAGGMRAFVGPRDDPFFIDLFGDQSVTSVLNAAFSQALGEPVGNPAEQSLSFNPNATDDLAGLNTLAIVVQLPKSQVANALGIAPDGVFYAWATTAIRN